MLKDSSEELPMDETEDQPSTVKPQRSRWKIGLLSAAGVTAVLLAGTWFSRETIVRSVVATELERLGIPAQYEIESIGPEFQVLTDVVIGNPQRPDFTAKRVVISVSPRFGMPQIGSVRLVEPRLYSTYRNGKLSLGSLDPLIFTGSEEPFSLPNMDLAIEDGRGLIESDYGAVGVKIAGKGHLQNGFSGMIAAVAPDLAVAGCDARDVTLYGSLEVSDQKPRLKGPLRFGSVQCAAKGVRLAKSSVQVDARAHEALDGVDGVLSLALGRVSMSDYQLGSMDGAVHFAVNSDKGTLRYDLNAQNVDTPQAKAPKLALKGTVRAAEGFKRVDADGEVVGSLAGLGSMVTGSLDGLITSGEGTLVSDLGKGLRDSLIRETREATFVGNFIARRAGEELSLVVPRADVRSRGGASLVSLSRLQLAAKGSGLAHITGNFSTGGTGLPQINGRVTRDTGDNLELRLRMAEYQAGTARLAIPQLFVVRGRAGGVGISGAAQVSGALPGGSVERLALPIKGNWSQNAGLSLWRECANLAFDKLAMAQLVLAKRSMLVCPARGGAIVRTTPQGLKIAAGVAALDMAGRLGQTPIRLASGPVGFAYPGNLDARAVNVTLGEGDGASKFLITRLAADIGSELSGTFDGAQVLLASVPLDLEDVSGRWRFADGALMLNDGRLLVEDREKVARFQPLLARDATLSLVNNRIEANALLREPGSDREVVRTVIRHDLGSGHGDADLFVENLHFDQKLQPDTLTHLALGVIANAKGHVKGAGKIRWNDAGVTSTGRFSTDDFDFAAAFGPVSGVSGAVEFTDLLGLVTKPDQQLRVKSINPGIEVNDGVFSYQLQPDHVVAINGATWPFMGGSLKLEPASLKIGGDDPMNYVLTIDGLDAALFLQRLELSNLSATGLFDGRMPLVFDKNGGRIENGYLDSRAPGGNVAYVGELTYEDLNAIANFAFDALRSVDYRQMRIDMDGSLEGELVTRVTFDGISQGEGANSNFLTRRIAKLPIRFRVNVRAPFMQLITSVRSLYDREYIRDPRALGIIDAQGVPAQPLNPPIPKKPDTPATRAAEPIQRSESDETP